jgi:hypothetical protein
MTDFGLLVFSLGGGGGGDGVATSTTDGQKDNSSVKI